MMNSINLTLISTFFLCGLAQAAPNEGVCLGLAKVAYLHAEGRDLGITESEAIAEKKLIKHKKQREAGLLIISYVYTVAMDKNTIRQMVYAKCLMGEYE